MTPGTEAVIAVLGTIGYLLIGWASVIVCSARFVNEEGLNSYGEHVQRRQNTVDSAWWLLLVVWPIVAAAFVVIGLGYVVFGPFVWSLPRIGRAVQAVTLKVTKKLNPKMEGWY